MKNPFKDKENRNFILILLGIAIVVALIGWIKSGGDFETAAAIFFAFFINYNARFITRLLFVYR